MCYAQASQFFKQHYHQYNQDILSTNTIYKIYQDDFGLMWLVSDKGVLLFNGSAVQHISLPGYEQELVNTVRHKNTLYGSTYTGKIYKIDMRNLFATEIILPKKVIAEESPFNLMVIKDNQLLISKNTGAFVGINLLRNDHIDFVKTDSSFYHYLIKGEFKTRENSNEFNFLGEKFRSRVVDSTILTQGNVFTIKNKKATLVYSANNKSNYKIITAYLKNGNDLFLGFLQSGGLIKYSNYSATSNAGEAQCLLDNVQVTDLLKDADDNIWVSTLHDGIFLFSKAFSSIKKFSPATAPFSENIWYVRNDKGLLNIGFEKLVLYQYDNYKLQKKWLGDTISYFNPVLLASMHQKEIMLFGVVRNFISNYKPFFKVIAAYPSKDQLIYDGKIYLASPKSLFIVDTAFTSLQQIKNARQCISITPLWNGGYALGTPIGLYINEVKQAIHARITRVREYHKTIFACSDSGLYIIRQKKLIHLQKNDGLPDNQCAKVFYNGGSDYVVLTKNGLAFIDSTSLKIVRTFYAQTIHDKCAIRYVDVVDDAVWLATNMGLYVLSKQDFFVNNNIAAKFYFYPVDNSEHEFHYTRTQSVFSAVPKGAIKLKLEAINFVPTNYTITYYVTDDGKLIDSLTTNDKFFYLNAGSPGKYLVKAVVRNDNNTLIQSIAHTITITPLWYQRSINKLLFVVLGALVLLELFKTFSKYYYKKKEQKLKEKYNNLQLQQKAFFTQMNPHFIFNALTPLQSHIIKNEKVASLEYLTRFSDLMRDMLKKSDTVYISLKDELDFIKKYIAIQKIRFASSFQFDLHIAANILQKEVNIPSMMLQPILENAIEHGVKDRGAAGIIILDFSLTTIKSIECIKITVKDNGIGIRNAAVFKKGHALDILQKRIETIKKYSNTIASLDCCRSEPFSVFTLILSKNINKEWMQ